MKITFLGDIMAEPPVLKAAARSGGTYDFSGVFAPVKSLLGQSDYVVGNLETPLAGQAAGYSCTHLCFNAPDEYVDALLDAGVDLVSTANNHTFDRGYAGMERTLQVLDYAVLVISGADGVQGHVTTLWRLLKRYQIPVFLFVNKMDQQGTDREALLEELLIMLRDKGEETVFTHIKRNVLRKRWKKS